MNKIIALLIFLLFPVTATAESLSLEQVQEAACRVTTYNTYGTPQAYGSGTVVSLNDKDVWILTNGHVVDGTINATAEFFDKGRISTKVPGKTVWRQYMQNTSIDLALIHCLRTDLGGYTPRVIRLAPTGYQIQPNLFIKGAGCPSGRWLQSWQSRITKNEGDTIDFLMPPQEGQSGSGILADIPIAGVVDTRLIGIVTWRYSDAEGDYGAGPSISRINQILKREAQPDKLPTRYRKAGPTFVVEQPSQPGDGICDGCGLPERMHAGEDKKCPRCQKHGLTFNEHLSQGQSYVQFCSPDGCFPYGRPRMPSPQQPGPPQLGPSIPVQPGGQLPPNIFGEEEKPAVPKVDQEKEAMKDALNRAKEEIDKLGKQAVEDKSKLDSLGKEKIALVEQNEKTNLSLKDWMDKAAELQKIIEDKKTWLDEQLGEGNHTWHERIIFLILGGGLFTTLWQKYGLPYLIRKTGKLPASIIQKLGSRYIRKILDDIKKGKGQVYNIESYEDDDEDPPIDIIEDEEEIPVQTQTTVKKKYEVEVSGQVDHKHEVRIAPAAVEFVRQYFQNLEKAGEKDAINNWALRTTLYKEAVAKLKAGTLNSDTGVTVLASKDAARLIEKYVTDMLYAKVLADDLVVNLNDKYNIEIQGYEGILYHEAVEKLRNETLDIKQLNHIEIANAIELYVRTKFLEKMFPSHRGCKNG